MYPAYGKVISTGKLTGAQTSYAIWVPDDNMSIQLKALRISLSADSNVIISYGVGDPYVDDVYIVEQDYKAGCYFENHDFVVLVPTEASLYLTTTAGNVSVTCFGWEE